MLQLWNCNNLSFDSVFQSWIHIFRSDVNHKPRWKQNNSMVLIPKFDRYLLGVMIWAPPTLCSGFRCKKETAKKNKSHLGRWAVGIHQSTLYGSIINHRYKHVPFSMYIDTSYMHPVLYIHTIPYVNHKPVQSNDSSNWLFAFPHVTKTHVMSCKCGKHNLP